MFLPSQNYFRDAGGISKDSFHPERGLQSDSFLSVSNREYEVRRIYVCLSKTQ